MPEKPKLPDLLAIKGVNKVSEEKPNIFLVHTDYYPEPLKFKVRKSKGFYYVDSCFAIRTPKHEIFAPHPGMHADLEIAKCDCVQFTLMLMTTYPKKYVFWRDQTSKRVNKPIYNAFGESVSKDDVENAMKRFLEENPN